LLLLLLIRDFIILTIEYFGHLIAGKSLFDFRHELFADDGIEPFEGIKISCIAFVIVALGHHASGISGVYTQVFHFRKLLN
jgi:hypothetical protein